ncbi:MAG: ABC transporter substrate-binding protein [Oscillospiraceae bacterium]|nr:ABC transporter substrate-binding protein [Oscillospiraceae bacterium]
MKKMIKILAALAAGAFLFVSCYTIEQGEIIPDTKVPVNVGCLKGPSGLSMVKLFKDNEQNDEYNTKIAGAPDQITAGLTSGELDIAAVPMNLAANLYNKTNGSIRVLAVSGLGNLYIMSRVEISTVADLEGKTVVVAGQGATTEYALRYVLDKNEISDKVTLEFKEPAETAVAAISGSADIVMLPEPFASQVEDKADGMLRVLDINEEWKNLNNGQDIVMTCVVARSDFIESNGDDLTAFLEKFALSVQFCNTDIDKTAEYAQEFEIMEAESVKKAIPYCAITFIKDDEMKTKISDFLTTLHEVDPRSVGGTVPDEGFYYNAAEN